LTCLGSSDQTSGRVTIGWGGAANQTLEYNIPIHMMSLTCLGYMDQTGGPQFSKGCRDKGIIKFNYRPATNDYKYNYLGCQDHQGGDLPGGNWALEKYDGPLQDLSNAQLVSSVFHKYSDIKLNLYGVYDIPIRYSVKLVQFMDEKLDPLMFSHLSQVVPNNSDCYSMMNDMLKPLLYNSVNTNPNKDYMRNIRVIKSADVLIQPISYSDQRAERLDAAEGQTIGHNGGHIHELRWFVRHDRFRKYDWDHIPYDQNPANSNPPRTNISLTRILPSDN